jgi:hypothetical protein
LPRAGRSLSSSGLWVTTWFIAGKDLAVVPVVLRWLTGSRGRAIIVVEMARWVGDVEVRCRDCICTRLSEDECV